MKSFPLKEKKRYLSFHYEWKLKRKSEFFAGCGGGGGSGGVYGRQYTPQVSICSAEAANAPNGLEVGGLSGGHSELASPSVVARSLLNRLSVRKPSLLSLSSNASSNGNGCNNDRKQHSSGSQEELFIGRGK